jgi:hypothetical protein
MSKAVTSIHCSSSNIFKFDIKRNLLERFRDLSAVPFDLQLTKVNIGNRMGHKTRLCEKTLNGRESGAKARKTKGKRE